MPLADASPETWHLEAAMTFWEKAALALALAIIGAIFLIKVGGLLFYALR